jgi:glyoxylase-like metal-dependent hydrolase (beta-lactamase superfamily II)
MILEALTVGPFQENCYVIGDEETGTGTLVDPGDEGARIALAVEQTGLDIAQIIITHAHIDHVGAVAALADEYACPVLMHAEAEPMLQQLPTQAMMMGLRFGKVPVVDRHIEDEEILEVGSGSSRSTRRGTRRDTWRSTSRTMGSYSLATRSSRVAWEGRIFSAATWTS